MLGSVISDVLIKHNKHNNSSEIVITAITITIMRDTGISGDISGSSSSSISASTLHVTNNDSNHVYSDVCTTSLALQTLY